jgi:hypothetical protein
MEPERLPEPLQLNFAGFVADAAAPEPVPIVVQPTASPTTSRIPALKVIHAIFESPAAGGPILDLQDE